MEREGVVDFARMARVRGKVEGKAEVLSDAFYVKRASMTETTIARMAMAMLIQESRRACRASLRFSSRALRFSSISSCCRRMWSRCSWMSRSCSFVARRRSWVSCLLFFLSISRSNPAPKCEKGEQWGVFSMSLLFFMMCNFNGNKGMKIVDATRGGATGGGGEMERRGA